MLRAACHRQFRQILLQSLTLGNTDNRSLLLGGEESKEATVFTPSLLPLHHFERGSSSARPLQLSRASDSPLRPRARCPRRRATRALLTLPSETRAPLLALCHVPGAIFNPAVTTTAKSHTAGLPGRRRGRRCVRACGGMDSPKDERRREPDNVVDDRDEK